VEFWVVCVWLSYSDSFSLCHVAKKLSESVSLAQNVK